MSACKHVSEPHIPDALNKLSAPELDQLLQQIMSGLAAGQGSLSSVLLRWHEHVVSKTGLGGILRAMTAGI